MRSERQLRPIPETQLKMHMVLVVPLKALGEASKVDIHFGMFFEFSLFCSLDVSSVSLDGPRKKRDYW